MELIIFGGGRWAKEIYNEAKKIKKIKKIFFLTKNKNFLINRDKTNSNIIVLKKFTKKILKKNSKIIICNKVENHNKILKKIISFKNDILIEKPLFLNTKSLTLLKNKKNIYFSNVFAFDTCLILFAKKLKRKKIIKSEIIWCDKKKEFRRGIYKTHNYKINYTFDVFSHLITLAKFTGFNEFDSKNNFNIKIFKKNFSIFQIFSNNITFIFKVNRVDSQRKRLIRCSDNSKIYEINFTKNIIINKKKTSFKSSKIHRFSYKSSQNLYRMIKSFIFKDNNLKNLSIENGINSLKLYNKFFGKL